MNIIIFFLFISSICQKDNHIQINKEDSIYSNESYYPLNEININNSKKNVILGIIHHYSLIKILPFFKSLIHANITNCDIVMFVRKVSQNVINYLRRINVIVYQIFEKYKRIKPTHLRWKMYKDFLKKNKNKYNLVFSVDVRDSIFQKDVFKFYDNFSPFLGVMIEDGTLEQDWNKENIINYIGEEMHKTIQNERIICMGTLLGSLEKFLEFSIILWRKLKLNNFPPSDQCVANCLFYLENVLKDFLLKSDNNGPIITLGITESENIILDVEDNVLNYKGEVAAVVHQYDRIVNLKKKIVSKYHLEFSDLIKSALDIQIYKIILLIIIIIKLIKSTKLSKLKDLKIKRFL